MRFLSVISMIPAAVSLLSLPVYASSVSGYSPTASSQAVLHMPSAADDSLMTRPSSRAGLGSASVTLRSFETDAPVETVGREVSEHNTASRLFARRHSLTEVEARFNWRQESSAVLEPLGDAAMTGEFNVRSHVVLNDRSAAVAGADYYNGVKRNVRWNSVSDYELLAPYVMADSLGGDLRTSQYSFYGGYAMRRRRFNWGAGAGYRALHEYRQTDPRPRSVVSDFRLDLSAGCLFDRYRLNADVSLRLYRQFQEVSFMNERGANTSELHFTGLGTHFGRFAGSGDYCATRYRGTGCDVALSLMPLHSGGFYALGGYALFDVNRTLANQNKVPITRMLRHRGYASLAYRGGSASFGWGVFTDGSAEISDGRENVIDNGLGNIYNVLCTMPMYRSLKAEADAGAVLTWRRSGGGDWSLLGRVEWLHWNSSYRYPSGFLSFDRLGGTLEAVGRWLIHGKWVVAVEFGTGGYGSVRGGLALPEGRCEAKVAAHYGSMYERLNDALVLADAGFRVQRSIGSRTAAYLRTTCRHSFFLSGENRDAGLVAIGLCF